MHHISKFAFAFTYPCPRKLREIMQMSLIERENKDSIVKIWMAYHAEKPNNVAYAMSKSEYQQFDKNTKESPLFLLPLKRKSGYFMLIGQAQKNSILFTYLEDYKKSATFSHPYFIMTMFDELLFSKGIALVRGDSIDYRVDQDESYYLMNQSMRLYLTNDLYSRFVYNMNHNQEEFDYEQFKAEFQI